MNGRTALSFLGAATSRWSTVVLFVVVGVALSGCSLQKMTVRQTANVLWDGQQALEGDPDPSFARDALPGSLKTIETFLESDPENEKLLRMLAKGYFSYTFAFVEADLERAQIEHASEERIDSLKESAVKGYMKSRNYGLRLLDEDFRKAAENLKLQKVEKKLAKMDEDDVPGLFWAAYGWGSAANLAQHDSDMVAALPIVEVMMRRVIDLDEEFFYSGPHMFFGVYYASRPPMFGGKPDKAKEHFEKAMEQNGKKNLMIPFLYARFYATQVQDRELFERLLNGMRDVNVEQHENVRLNNEVALDRAQYWGERIDDLFYSVDEPADEVPAEAEPGSTGGFGDGGGFEGTESEDTADDAPDEDTSSEDPAPTDEAEADASGEEEASDDASAEEAPDAE
ncbi:MAG: TRAP transporter TatT component family protein [Myxococcota bacterium]